MTEDNKKELMDKMASNIVDAVNALVAIDNSTAVTSTNNMVMDNGDTWEVTTKIKRTPKPKETEA